CCISYYFFGAFGIVWLPYKSGCTTGRTSAKVRAMKSRQNFLQRTPQIHPIRPQTDVLVHFVLFGCIYGRLVAYETRCETGRTSAKVRARKSRRNFSQRTHPIHPIGPIMKFWCVSYYLGAFETVWLSYKLGAKRAELVQKFVP